MNASQTCYDLIKSFESLALRAYLCPSKKWTIGYGSTKNVRPTMVINTEEANRRLIVDVDESEDGLRFLIKVPVNQAQFDALVSWVFNVGLKAAEASTLIRKLNAGDSTCSVEFLKWNRATIDGKRIPLHGLTRRRITERRLFETGILLIEQ